MIFEISTLEFAEMQRIMQKKKNIEFGTKMSYWLILGCNFEKSTVIFEINILTFAKMQRFVQNQKPLFLVPKMPDLGVFRLQF